MPSFSTTPSFPKTIAASLGLFALLVIGAPVAFGQTTTTAPATTTTPPADATTPVIPDATAPLATNPDAPKPDAPKPDAATPTDLSMGAEDTSGGLPTQADAEVGKTYLANTFDAWEQRCLKTADGSDPCQLYQLLKDKDGNAVAEISIFDLPADSVAVAGATVMVPLETLLTANLRIGVDTAKQKLYPFTYCTAQGCVSRVGFTAEELSALKKGVKGTMTIVPAVAPDKTVDLAISLKSFTKGFDAMKAANEAGKK